MKIRTLLITVLMAAALALSGEVIGADISANEEELTCSSLAAVYKPHLSSESESKYLYKYRMTIERTGNLVAGEPWYQFVIEVSDGKNIITRLKMPYDCGHGSAPTCAVWYAVKSNNGREEKKSFGIISLDHNFYKTIDIAAPDNERGYMAPYLILFPGFASRVSYTRWVAPSRFLGLEAFTNEIIPPEGIEVWRLHECLNG